MWTRSRATKAPARNGACPLVLAAAVAGLPLGAAAPPPDPIDPDGIVARLMSPHTTRAAADEAWRAVEGLHQDAWVSTLRRLVMLAQEPHAVIATTTLVHGCVSDVEQLIADHIVEWSDTSQRSVLQAIAIAERVDELR